MKQLIIEFPEPVSEKSAVPKVSRWTFYSDRDKRKKNIMYPCPEGWMPSPGDIVVYKGCLAKIDGISTWVGMHVQAYMLESLGDIALIYFPGNPDQRWNTGWIGTVDIWQVYPDIDIWAERFCKLPILEEVISIYPFIKQ